MISICCYRPCCVNSRYYFYVVSTFLLTALFFASQSHALEITTGQPAGVYYPVGNAIKKLLEENGETSVTVQISNGSIDNLKRLLNYESDIGLVQSDVLYKVRHSRSKLFDDVRADIKDLRSLMALFSEYIQIVVRKESKLSSVQKLYGKRVYLGRQGSGTLENAKDILGYYRINLEDINQIDSFESSSDAIDAVKRGDIDAAFVTSAELIKDPSTRNLSIDEEAASNIKREKPYFGNVVKLDHHNNLIRVLYTRAVLVARAANSQYGMRKEDAYKQTKIIYRNQARLGSLISQEVAFFKDDQMVRKVALRLHSGSESYFNDADVLARTGAVYLSTLTALGLISFLIIVIQWGGNWKWVLWLRERKITKYLYFNNVTRLLWDKLLFVTTNSGWVMGIWVFLFILMADVWMISVYEKMFSIENDIENPFAGASLLDIFYWIMTFSVTGFHQDLFPNSYPARISAIVMPVSAVLGAFIIVIHQTIQSDHRKESMSRGVIVQKIRNHVLICGWNNRVPNLIRNITSEFCPNSGTKVIVLAEIDQEKPLEKYGFEYGVVHYCRGMSSDYQKLHDCNIEESKGAIIVADDKKVSDNNLRGVFTSVAIRKCLKPSTKDYPIITELYYAHNEQYFKYSGVSKLIYLNGFSARLISHATLNPGVSDLIINLLSFDYAFSAGLATFDNELGKAIGISKYYRKTYRETVEGLADEGVLLVEIYKENANAKTLDLEFDTTEQYILNHDEATVREEDAFLVIKTPNQNKPRINVINITQNLEERYRNNNVRPFEHGKEVVLFIGDGDIVSIVSEDIRPYCKSIIQINPDILKESNSFEELENNDAIKNLRTSIREVSRIIICGHRDYTHDGEKTINPDDATMMFALKLKKFYEEIGSGDRINIIAELSNVSNLQLYKDIGVTQSVPTNEFIEKVVSQQIYHSGRVSGFFLKSMSYTRSNTKVRLEKKSVKELKAINQIDLIGKSYESSLKVCLNNKIILLAVEKGGNKNIVVNLAYDGKRDGNNIAENDYVYIFTKPVYVGGNNSENNERKSLPINGGTKEEGMAT